MSNKIELESMDGEVFEIDMKTAKLLGIVRTMIIDLGLNKNDDEIVPVRVPSLILKKVIQWAAHHKDDILDKEHVDESFWRTKELSPWDMEFFKVDQATLYDLISAANYLDIKGLLEAGCKTIATMISGKSPEEMRRQFNIPNDFSPSEEEQIRKENEWCGQII